eukprot:COSAG06_NODE_3488_length_5272_cov_8.685720_8_plen_59_part_00
MTSGIEIHMPKVSYSSGGMNTSGMSMICESDARFFLQNDRQASEQARQCKARQGKALR